MAKALSKNHQQPQTSIAIPDTREFIGRSNSAHARQKPFQIRDLFSFRDEQRRRREGPIERKAVGPNDQRGEMQHPGSVEQVVVSRAVVFGARAEALDAEADGVEDGVAGGGARDPDVFDAALAVVEVFAADGSAEEALRARVDLELDDVYVHGHVC